MEKQSCVSVSRDFLDVFALTRKQTKLTFSISSKQSLKMCHSMMKRSCKCINKYFQQNNMCNSTVYPIVKNPHLLSNFDVEIEIVE